MTEGTARQVMVAIENRVAAERMPIIKNKLLAAPEEKADEVVCAALYKPSVILLLSIFLGGFGVDRFAIGDIGLGLGKLLVGWLTCGIWPLIDIFFGYKRAKEKNFLELMNLL